MSIISEENIFQGDFRDSEKISKLFLIHEIFKFNNYCQVGHFFSYEELLLGTVVI